MSSQITSFLQTNLEFIGCDWQSNIRLLDYACGTGMVTQVRQPPQHAWTSEICLRILQALASSVTEAVGVDISSVMIEKYAEFTKSTKNRLGGALSPQTYVGNLLAAVDDEHKQNELDRQLSGFDLVAVGLGFHHFPDHQSAVERLSARLKGGGVLLVIDFTPQNKLVAEGEQGTRGDISASGFASAQMRVLFEAAGLTTFAYREMEQQVELHRSDRVVKKTVFMARGRKP